MAKWEKAGIARLSKSGKVINLAIYETDAKKWFILDVEKLFELIEGNVYEVPIFEAKA